VTELRYRLLGRTGLRVSELFLGAMTFGDPDTVGAALEECRRILDAYADAGGNVVDTAINDHRRRMRGPQRPRTALRAAAPVPVRGRGADRGP
jgi:predicted aldo/keto reductase-like oxidoreductase